jgi:hypothetical protein
MTTLFLFQIAILTVFMRIYLGSPTVMGIRKYEDLRAERNQQQRSENGQVAKELEKGRKRKSESLIHRRTERIEGVLTNEKMTQALKLPV